MERFSMRRVPKGHFILFNEKDRKKRKARSEEANIKAIPRRTTATSRGRSRLHHSPPPPSARNVAPPDRHERRGCSSIIVIIYNLHIQLKH